MVSLARLLAEPCRTCDNNRTPFRKRRALSAPPHYALRVVNMEDLLTPAPFSTPLHTHVREYDDDDDDDIAKLWYGSIAATPSSFSLGEDETQHIEPHFGSVGVRGSSPPPQDYIKHWRCEYSTDEEVEDPMRWSYEYSTDTEDSEEEDPEDDPLWNKESFVSDNLIPETAWAAIPQVRNGPRFGSIPPSMEGSSPPPRRVQPIRKCRETSLSPPPNSMATAAKRTRCIPPTAEIIDISEDEPVVDSLNLASRLVRLEDSVRTLIAAIEQVRVHLNCVARKSTFSP